MISNLSRRVDKIEQKSAASQGGDNLFHIAKPPGMTMDAALREPSQFGWGCLVRAGLGVLAPQPPLRTSYLVGRQ